MVGSRRIMPKGEWRIRSGTVRIEFGEPIGTDALEYGDRDKLAVRSRAAVAALRGGEGPTS